MSNEAYPKLQSALSSGVVVVDDDNDYRVLDGVRFGHPERPIKIAPVGHEDQAERHLTEKNY